MRFFGFFSLLFLLGIASAAGCPVNTTLPGGAALGDCFVLNTTGRTVQMTYNGTNWLPSINFGKMTLYVNSTNGTNNETQGTGVGTAAFKTIQYAIDQIPPVNMGSIVINIAGGTYQEPVVIQGKGYTGAYTISLVGQSFTTTGEIISATADSYLRGNATSDSKPISPDRLNDTGAFSAYGVNGLRGYFFTKDNSTFYPIVGNDNNTLMIGDNSITSVTTYSVYAPPVTKISNSSTPFTVGYGQVGIVMNNTLLNGTSTNPTFALQDNSITEMNNVYYVGANTNNGAGVTSSRLNFLRSYGYMPYASRFLLTLTGGAVALTTNSVLYSLGATCIRANQISQVSGSPAFHIGSGVNQGYTLNSGQSTLFGQYFENFSVGVAVDYAGQITWQNDYWIGCVNTTTCVTKSIKNYNQDTLFGDGGVIDYINISSDGLISVPATDNSTQRMCLRVLSNGDFNFYRCDGGTDGGGNVAGEVLILAGIALLYIAFVAFKKEGENGTN